MLDDMSRIRYVNRLEDVIIVHEGAEYICLMKLFPTCEEDDDVSEEDYRRFHLRYYIPREYFNDARKKIDRILIMTNGLNEFDKYLLYDQLGSRLASLGYAAVLLPLPDHLNRHIRYRLKQPSEEKIKTKPSEEIIEKPMELHYRYLQFKRELARLCAHIDEKTRNPICNDPKSPCSFYDHFFAPVVRVSYFGYSLGGATMLCDFLSSQARLNACFLLNPAIKLPAVDGRRLIGSQRRWKEYMRRLLTEFEAYKGPDKDEMFREIMLGQFIIQTRELLSLHRQRLLFIYGGADTFTRRVHSEDITPEDTGSGMFIIPGVVHTVAEDPEWKKWSTLTVKLISDFEENAAREVITQEALERLQSGKRDASEISEEDFRKSEEWYRPSLLGIPQRMAERQAAKKRVETRVRETPLQNLRLGEMLRKKDIITFDELYDALDEQRRSHDEQRGSHKRIGDILVDMFRLVSREQVEVLASLQSRPKDEA
jgi:hypothetical protein